jgi:proteasome lid subunit RPN8/RPN11
MSIKSKIEFECEKDTSQERCGFVVHKDGELDLIMCENRAEDKKNEFYIPAKEFLHVKNNNDIVAIYHSHNDGTENASQFDIQSADIICYPFLIYCTKNNKFGVHTPEYSDAKKEHFEQLMEEIA